VDNWRLLQCRINSGCFPALDFETDDGRTLAGADASILGFVDFIAFFWHRLSVTLPYAARFTDGGDSAAVRKVHSKLSES
jgi:hypothetical protein